MCTNPLLRIEHKLGETFTIGKNGKPKPYVEFTRECNIDTKAMKEWEKKITHGDIAKVSLIACGKCLECKLAYSLDKAVQGSLESMHPRYKRIMPLFLTFTYDDEHIRFNKTMDVKTGEVFEGTTVWKKDMQDFWKLLRYYYPDEKLIYFDCCEYGKTTHRPHAHAIVWGLPLDQTKWRRVGNNERGDPIFVTDEEIHRELKYKKKAMKFNDIWGKGTVYIGEATFDSIGYVARYTLKKAKGEYNDWWYLSQGKLPEWVSMSDNIGKWYYDEHLEEIYDADAVPIIHKGRQMKPPRSYDRLCKRDHPELYEKVQQKRKEQAETGARQRESQSDVKGWAYLAMKEMLGDNFKDLRGEGYYGL